MAVMPWSPLAGGFLTGKYQRENTKDIGRLSGANPFGDSKFTDRNWGILAVLGAVAEELDRPVAQVALAWTIARAGVTSTLIGVRSVAQIESNIAAAEIFLTDDQMERLNAASAPPYSFSSSLTTRGIRKMIFGGNVVAGWGD